MHADRSSIFQVRLAYLVIRLHMWYVWMPSPYTRSSGIVCACSSIRSFADEFKKRQYPLHVLVNNAGVFIPPTDRTEENFEVTLGINHFGPFYLTHLLLNNLEQSAPSRIVNLG